MIVPSTGKTITYRPYVVKEEKLLLIAMESQDENQIEKAVLNIIKECVESPINVDDLTTFDVEMIFITLRSKSVGEGIKITPKCKHCEESNEVKIDLEKITVENLSDTVDKHIKLTDDISIDLKWHTMKDRTEDLKKETETETIINMIVASLETIYSGEEIFAVKDSSKKETLDFVESLNTDQFNNIVEVLSKSPYMSYDLKFDCKKCSKENTMEMKGLTDFFQ
jgi:transcription elongation factor Elf1